MTVSKPANEEPIVSVVMPLLNGGRRFHECLERVLEQDFPEGFEVVVIDSGSTDGSWERLQASSREHSQVRALRIPQAAFGHGKTRNLGVAESRGEFVAFLTQDAVPVDQAWLGEMVGAARRHPKAAGVFGRHRAWPEHGTLLARGMDAHFDGFGEVETVFQLDDPERYKSDPAYRQRLHFYSDNNSLLRKSVWEKLPYPDVTFGEDQLWAKAIIEAGYQKVYNPKAVVFHSHRYGFFESKARAREEALFYYNYFGYRLGAPLKPSLVEAWKKTRGDLRLLRELAPEELSLWERLNLLRENFGLFLGHWSARRTFPKQIQ